MSHCDHCPLKGTETPCPAKTRPYPRYCRLMDPGHPDHDTRYARPILMLAGVLPAEAAPAREVTATAAVPRGATPGSDFPLGGDLLEKALKRIKADKLAELWTRWTGQPCNCDARREAINRAHERLNRWLGMGG